MPDRTRARRLASESIAMGDATGWFERLYAEAQGGEAVVPWADLAPNPHVVEWLDRDAARVLLTDPIATSASPATAMVHHSGWASVANDRGTPAPAADAPALRLRHNDRAAARRPTCR